MEEPEQREHSILRMITSTVREKEPDAEVILYGSRARKTARSDSDWDVLILVNKQELGAIERGELEYSVWDKGLVMGEEINATAYTRSQWEQAPPSLFKHNVTKEGVRL